MDLFKKCYDYTLVEEYKKKGIYPYFHALESRQDKVVQMESKRRIMLGSNNYLGLTACPEVVEAGIKAMEKYGTGCSGSRFLNGTLDLHLELEKELASFLRKDDACTWSTGFQSNLGIISAIAGKNDIIFCDRENHASIYDGCRLSLASMVRYHHNDMEELEKLLQQADENAGKLIITDGVFSMRGDIANIPRIVELAKAYGARVMIDDAHGLGVIGEGGRGTASYWGLENEVDIYMGTFSKSLASLGGYMVASQKVINYVKHHSRPFIFSASLPPANAACALAALRHLEANPGLPRKLAGLSDYARRGMVARNVPISLGETPIIPIYLSDADTTLQVAKDIFDAGVYVNPVLPPATGPNECLLRTSYMASLTESLIDEALDIIASVLGDRFSKQAEAQA
ncbi:MAG: pyridoxal phosphate-dependent aminotransferase family protein [Sphaerochaetaceae bacterium]|jgi:8-amino-7-oxononanoate synthase|nr:pyridoxal phosphate-dependent aminotransferase family protein [Sphaerochaetaceae bacterium]